MSNDPLAQHWLESAFCKDVAHDLENVYAAAAIEIARRGPACWASGRCCNFDKAGHRLYVTGLEAAYAISKLPEIAGTRKENFPEPKLRLLVLEDARARGGCPFQLANLCGIHAIKPLGCRVYFCDQSAQQWQQDLSEQLIAEIRALHDRYQIEYRYGEWRQLLQAFIDADAPIERS